MRRLIWILCLPVLIHAQTADDVARQTETKLRSYKSLRADFEQIYFSSTISTPDQESGRLYIQKPGWMRWEYEKPEKKVFLLKEDMYQMYYPEDKELVQTAIGEEDADADVLSLLSGKRGILDHYDVAFNPFPTENKNVHQLKLTPRGKEPDSYILLEIEVDTWNLIKVISFDWSGNKQEFHFSKIETDITFPRDTFELKVPPDVEIIK